MTTEELRTLKLQDEQKKKCDICKKELDDDGLCPDCDLGGEATDDDSPEESLDEEVEYWLKKEDFF